MAELPDMPDDYKKFIVQSNQEQQTFLAKIGRYAHDKEIMKLAYFQFLVLQIVFALFATCFARLTWGSVVLKQNLTAVLFLLITTMSLLATLYALRAARRVLGSQNDPPRKAEAL